MQLNLSIIKDALLNHAPIQLQVDKMTPRRLKQVQFLPDSGDFEEDILYFGNAEELPVEPALSAPLALICIGFLPTAYTVFPQCESLCFSTSTNERALFQEILEIFGKFIGWDSKLKDMLIENRPFAEFGKMALEIFETPAHAYGAFEKIIFMAYNETDTESRELYASYADGYILEDERSILYTDKDFIAAFSEKGPTFSSNGIYKTQIIFNNIYNESAYIGRFLIENTYRPFKESDYALTEWFSEYVRLLLLRSRQFYFQTTREFEQMMQELFDSQYIFLEQRFILQIINMSQISIDQAEILHKTSVFLKNNALLAGISSLYNDFTQTPLHFQQARMMAGFALHDRHKKLYEFDKYVLSLMLHQLKETGRVDLFCNNKIQKLLTYDVENGTELLKTLKVYMDNNQNVSRTNKELFIARTTCLYRLERIREITHINFDDPKENLYVRLILQMLSEKN